MWDFLLPFEGLLSLPCPGACGRLEGRAGFSGCFASVLSAASLVYLLLLTCGWIGSKMLMPLFHNWENKPLNLLQGDNFVVWRTYILFQFTNRSNLQVHKKKKPQTKTTLKNTLAWSKISCLNIIMLPFCCLPKPVKKTFNCKETVFWLKYIFSWRQNWL